MGDKFVDILMVLSIARQRDASSDAYMPIDVIRRDAIETYAQQQFETGRYKNLDSAVKTIHDACTQRLKPQVTSIEVFDRLLKDALAGKPRRLAEVLRAHSRSPMHDELIAAFLEQPPHH